MKRKRLFALLLALAMLLTFMPTMAFADGEGNAQTDPDLSHYEIKFKDIREGDWRLFTDSNTGITINVDVVLKTDKAVVVGTDKYDLKIIKETYDADGKKTETECTNGQLALDDNGTFSGRVYAVAKEGSDYRGHTDEGCYVDIFHRKTLYPFGPDVSFDEGHRTSGPMPMTDYYLYSTADTGTVPSVKIDTTQLTKDTDYTVAYVKEGSESEAGSASFPAEPGTYICRISAISGNASGYYGVNDAVRVIVTAADDYEQAKKDSDAAQEVINLINSDSYDFTDPDPQKTKEIRSKYDALTPAGKAFISEREYGRLEVAEFILLMKGVDPANPSSAAVKAARAKYDSMCETAKTAFLEMAYEKQGNLKQKLEAAEKKLREKAAAEEEARRKQEEARRAEALEWNGTQSSAIPAAKSVKAKAAKRSIKVSWKKASKKNLKKFDRVEIQISTDPGFAKANTQRFELKKTSKSRKIKGLQKNTTYYVRVRNVQGSGTAKVVSGWKTKKVKVKK